MNRIEVFGVENVPTTSTAGSVAPPGATRTPPVNGSAWAGVPWLRPPGRRVSNSEFLRVMYGELPEGVAGWVATFREDPAEGRWAGYPWTGEGPDELDREYVQDWNTFCVLSTFRGQQIEDGSFHFPGRRGGLLVATHWVMIDDVGTGPGAKIHPDKWPAGLVPTYIIETSPGNYQIGLRFAVPLTDAAVFGALTDALIEDGLQAAADPGMKGATRYCRLPEGANTKQKYGKPFRHRLIHWEPGRAYAPEEVLEAFGIDPKGLAGVRDRIASGRRGGDSGAISGVAPEDDPWLAALEEAGLVKGRPRDKGDGSRAVDIECPWRHEHTGGEDTGSAWMVGQGFACHHGHCEKRTAQDVKEWLTREFPEAAQKARHAEMAIAFALPPDIEAPDLQEIECKELPEGYRVALDRVPEAIRGEFRVLLENGSKKDRGARWALDAKRLQEAGGIKTKGEATALFKTCCAAWDDHQTALEDERKAAAAERRKQEEQQRLAKLAEVAPREAARRQFATGLIEQGEVPTRVTGGGPDVDSVKILTPRGSAYGAALKVMIAHGHYPTYRLNDMTRSIDAIWKGRAVEMRKELITRQMNMLQADFDCDAVSYAETERQIELLALQDRYHPVREYLRGLEWDGAPRLDTWLPRAVGCLDTPYFRAVGVLWVLAAVGRVLRPGHPFRLVPVFQGAQGVGKTTVVRLMAVRDEWFAEVGLDPRNSDETVKKMHGSWHVEIGELRGFRKIEAEEIKSLISRSTDSIRRAYSPYKSSERRDFVMSATTNDLQFLTDSTGNTRYMPVPVERVDFDWIEFNRDQIYAEAVARFDPAARLDLPEGVWEEAEELRDGAFEADPWEEEIANRLMAWEQRDYTEVHASTVQEWLGLELSQMRGSEGRRIRAIMKRLGWESTQHAHDPNKIKRARGYRRCPVGHRLP